MPKLAIVRHLLAFLAAVLIVSTAIYMYVLWRNHAPQQVMDAAAGHIVYQAAGMAIGISRAPAAAAGRIHAEPGQVPAAAGQAEAMTGATRVMLLRYTADGGWVVAGQGRAVSVRANPGSGAKVQLALIPNTAVGLAGAYWLCAWAPRGIDAMAVVNPAHPRATDMFRFHAGGIIEPVSLFPDTLLEGRQGSRTVFRLPAARVLTAGTPRE
ncbi:hypothetical protein GCM10010885_08960 [Alicyclobacillus cellulosilyticus]|uniref:Uncharacterized protein n=1 Tax=Alicyclobacillus cellulosilyticus TaxID=1003997 RepID=A0A917K5X4_9BACL|nr:hypothetical protein [Alicyclobacillus cellulosilyticus]GGJ01947.1 hypothetical protein GCM10010885_08960 [Alicyclobacillus cellulosilyticus]